MKPQVSIKLSDKRTLIIDADDYEHVKDLKLSVVNQSGVNLVVYKSQTGTNVALKRKLVPSPSSKRILHRNGNYLDLTKENLRVMSAAQVFNETRDKVAVNLLNYSGERVKKIDRSK